MTPQITAPPWEHVGQLFSFGAYLYVLLFALAIACGCMYRTPFLRRLASVPEAPLQNGFARLLSVAAVSGFVARNAVYIAVFRMLASTGICVAYVYNTYIGYIPSWLFVMQKLLGVTLLLQFIGKMLISPHPVTFIGGGESFMEVFSLASLIMARRRDWLNFSFLQAYIVLSRYFQIEPTLELVFNEKTSPFHRQLTRLTLEFIAFIYVFACGLQLFERLGDPWQALTATTFELTLANSFYFTVVTIFTVGYGDFVPYTLMGRLWIIFIIVFGAYLVTRKIGQVIDVVSSLRRGLGQFVKGEGVDHCVICGNVKWEYLKSFVLEFYGDVRNNTKKLVVICDQPNWTEETWNKFFASHAEFRNNVVYLEGSCVSRDDLVRAQVDDAKAVFVLNNQHNPDPYAEDSETLKRILTIRSYMPNIPIYSMCALRDSMHQITYALEHLSEIQEAEESMSRRASVSTGMNLISQEGAQTTILRSGGFGEEGDGTHPASAYYSGDFDDDDDDDGLLVASYDGSSDLKSEAICMQEVEMSLLAENVFCNGLSTLLANLILRVNPQTKPTDQPWAIEYKIGSECRFEYVKLPLELHDKKFSDIAMIMYDYGVLLIATKRFMDKKWRAVTPDTTIHLSTIGLIITFHSTHFLEKIMLHIARRVRETYDSMLETGSQDVPSLDDELATRSVPRHIIAGDSLTGDLAYDYEGEDGEDDETTNQPSLFRDSGKSWPNPGRVLDEAAHYERNIGQPIADPRSLPEPSISVSPLAKPPARDPSRPLIIARANVSNVPIGFATEPREASPRDRDKDILTTEPPLPSLNLAVPRTENTFAEITDDDGSSAAPSSYPKVSTNAITNAEGDVELEGSRIGSGVRNLSRSVGSSSVVANSGDDNANDSEDGPPSALRESESRKRGNMPMGKVVTFPQPIPGTGSGSAGRNGSNGAPSRKPSPDIKGGERPFIFFGDDELPMKASGHIVVCTIGQMAMMNLKLFLQRVWVARESAAEDTPVVAICSHVSEEDEADLSAYSSERLFLIQGNSLSVKTLERAQFQKAKAIVILACEDKIDVDHMDAQAIFTVMTLDYLLGERSETFVCTMLDAEESMQLLRAPAHPRRRGADLGVERDFSLEFGVSLDRMRSSRTMSRIPISGFSRFLAGRGGELDSKRSFGNRTFSFGALSGAGDLPRSMSFVGIRNSTYTDRKVAIERHLGIRDPNVTSRKFSSNSFGPYRNPLIPDDEGIMNMPSIGGASALNFLMNPSTLTIGGGAALHLPEGALGRGRGLMGPMTCRARDESFERERYASGEMMISSTYMSLLIREYAMPGLMAVVRKIFGAGIGKNSRSKRCWIRTIHIPHKWILAGEDGQRTYREVFEVLLGHGAVALGLYRAGDAMVRVALEIDPDFEEDEYVRSRTASPESRYGPPLREESPATPRPAPYDPLAAPDEDEEEDHGLEMGGDSVPRLRTSLSFERSAILHNLQTYGTMEEREDEQAHRTNQSDLEPGAEEQGTSEKIDIPPSIMFGLAEDVQAAQQSETIDDVDPPYQKYTCPSSGRSAYFKEVPGGENVLPYVYTNPEAYTLVSEHDAVYVLVSPQMSLPTENW